MENNRRNFLKIAGIGLASAGISPALAAHPFLDPKQPDNYQPLQRAAPHFNMSGYAAPKLDTVRIGFVGVGGRGTAAVKRIAHFDGVKINGLADIRTTQVEAAKKDLKGSEHNPALYSGDKDAWKKLCERDDIDLIYIATHWDLHSTIAVYAMEHGKHVAIEVPAAKTVEQCWQLVEASEKYRRHCTMLENCCYDFFEMLTLNMARQGVFGEIIHCEGAYIHYILESLFTKTNRWEMWRLKENAQRNGNLYPTHGLGPVAQIMNLNRGDKLDYMVSMSGNDFSLANKEKEMAAKDDFYKPFLGKNFRGNMNSSLIRTTNGKTIMIQHDVSSPRVYSRIHLVSGTNGMAQKYPLPGKISLNSEEGTSNHGRWLNDKEYKEIEQKYMPELMKKIGAVSKKLGGHGGMDLISDWRMIDCLRNGLPMDIDVYDAALWSVIGPLSEKSVASHSSAVEIPDFTRGAWKTNQPVDISAKGGTTNVRVEEQR